MPQQDTILRKATLTILSWTAIAFAYALVAVLAASSGVGPGIFAYTVIFAAFAYLFWLAGWKSAIRILPDRVVVDNFLMRHSIPWTALAYVRIGSGIEFRIDDETIVRSAMYAGSLTGTAAGYPGLRPVAARLEAIRAEKVQFSIAQMIEDNYVSWYDFSFWPPIVILATMELVAVVAYLLS